MNKRYYSSKNIFCKTSLTINDGVYVWSFFFVFSLLLLWLSKRWEQVFSNLWNSLLVDEFHASIESLRAHNPVLLGVHLETTEARLFVLVVVCAWIVCWQEVSFVDLKFASEFFFGLFIFKSNHLFKHGVGVPVDGIFDTALDKIDILFTNLQGDFGFDQFDHALNK